MKKFIHLHNHTHYSLLDAISTPKGLLDIAAADGQEAFALTDHGIMFGTYEFYNYAAKVGVKPIIGMEAYVANGDRFTKIAGKAQNKKMRNYFHLILLAKDITGYKNLMKLTTLGHLEGYYYKPRVDKELLEKYREGLIVLSSCIAGVVSAHLINDDYQEARNSAKYYKDVFGDDFYLELQDHKIDVDKIILNEVPKIAKELGIKLVATNDIHYEKKEHAIAHNVMLYINKNISNTTGEIDIYNLRYRTDELYLKSQEEMTELFKEFPEAIESTLEIADKCDLKFESKLYMPNFPIPKESKADSLFDYLKELTYKGLETRFDLITDEIKERTDYELDVIGKMGFPGYFLIVWDFVNAANKMGVRVGPGRGSAAGSLVAYALGITNVNPLPYGLLFERFLNPERDSMPDIDIDFADADREKVINYVKQKYGENSVAMIITFGKLSTRMVLTDVGRVLGVKLSKIKDITSKIPVVRGRVTPLEEAIQLPELKWLKDSKEEEIQKLIKFSLILENKIRNVGTHAAGVVIAPGNITDYVPIYHPPKSKEQGVDITTQYSMKELEEAGLLKMDFLGLKTLTIINDTLEMIESGYGEKIDIDKIDFGDPKTYELIAKGFTEAVFQFESDGMREYLKQLQPKNLEELTAMNALYRPGPMENIPEFIDRKFGRKPITYLHPIMEPALKNTYGIIVYQEQVMQLVRDIAGFSFGKADILRRAMGKKNLALMDSQKPEFFEGAAEKGINKALAGKIFDLIVKFADYGFNKSHSLAYSYLAFQTAWLKAHYPAEFLSANMTSELNNQDKIVKLIDEAKKFGIKLSPPDINISEAKFVAKCKTIFFGLAGIKNVGIPAVEKIAAARSEKNFESFFDFCARVDSRNVNRKTLEALICSGAFDSINKSHRAALFEAIDTGLSYSKSKNSEANSDSVSLFGDNIEIKEIEPKLPEVPKWSHKAKLLKEKEFLNFYLTGNPLQEFLPHVNSLSTIKLNDLDSPLVGENVRVCGMITELRTTLDKRNNTIAFFQLIDFTGKAEILVWSDAYKKFSDVINPDDIVLITGKSEKSDQQIKITADEIISIKTAVSMYAKGYYIRVYNDNDFIQKLRIVKEKLMTSENSDKEIIFSIVNKESNTNGTKYYASNQSINVDHSTTQELIELFGSNNIGLISK